MQNKNDLNNHNHKPTINVAEWICQVLFGETDEPVVSNNDEGQAPEACDNHNTIISDCYSMTQRNLH